MASYRSPVGRLASSPVGEQIDLPNGDVLEVAEKAILRPVRGEQGWDSRNSEIHRAAFRPVSVESLRTFLPGSEAEQVDEDLLQRLLDEEADSGNLIEGLRRSVLTQMKLRDQPILDQFQDSIFRLPLDSRLLLLGPPGTGKTTTLIRRLGQKLDVEFLTEDERNLIQGLRDPNNTPHSSSWMMFTPTALLRQYIKESFSREGIPASDNHVRTWSEYRWELARNTLGLLRSPQKQGGFILQSECGYLSDGIVEDITKWFDDFDTWQRGALRDRIVVAIDDLESIGDGRFIELAKKLSRSFRATDSVNLAGMVQVLHGSSGEMRELRVSLQQSNRDLVRRALNLQVNRDSAFLDELAGFLDGLEASGDRDLLDREGSTDDDLPEGEETDEDEDEDEAAGPRRGRRAAALAYGRAVRSDALAESRGRRLRKGTRNERVVEWIGPRGLRQNDRARVGRNQRLASALRPLLSPIRVYIDGVAGRYRRYRRLRQSEARWYSPDEIRGRDIGPLEVDMLLLSVLRFSKELLQLAGVRRGLEEPFWAPLQPIHDQYRNQVVADEATDFSPVQLACMLAITHPITQSFFACGDFNQRLTLWGTRDASEVAWAERRIRLERVTIGYRQSRQLNEFARAIVQIASDSEHDVILRENADTGGVAPVLMERAANVERVCRWLAERVVEIERFVRQLPSIAILVPAEEQVGPLAESLGGVLSEQNINVVACRDGQVIGQENDVRVFDAQHIKGLEFEAAFFIDVDRLADMYPELFDKFLYVGATRAATYLGITCVDTLPSRIEELRPMFGSDWKE